MGKGDDPNCRDGVLLGAGDVMDLAPPAVPTDAPTGISDEDIHRWLREAARYDSELDLPRNWNSETLNISYVDDAASLADCVAALTDPQVTRVALDIETTGGLKPWYGSVRLIQVGVEMPEPRQFLIDCWAVDPGDIFPVLTDENTEIITCNGLYEQSWLEYRYGVHITNLWDVSYASKAITKVKQDLTRENAKQQRKRAEAPYRQRLNDLRKAHRSAAKAEDADALQHLTQQVAQAEADLEAVIAQAKEDAPKPRKISNDFRRLMRRYVGKKISKTQQTSQWGDPVLSDAQRRYAAMDVAGLLDIRRGLGREIHERKLHLQVADRNEEVLDRARRELRSGDDCAYQFAQLARCLLHARTADQLEQMFALQGQMTIHHRFRPKLREIRAQRHADLAQHRSAA